MTAVSSPPSADPQPVPLPLSLRFDFRLAPQSPATMAELYHAALDMARWADERGAVAVLFSEHHAADDGYLPSPVVMAAAAAACTTRIPINVGALLLLMYDPVKLAEDISVIDHLSAGRVSWTLGLGYRDEEYAMFGVDRSRRGAHIEERIGVLRRALAGETFTWEGRTVRVRPEPYTPGGPLLAYGGGSPEAARRAARLGMLFIPQTSDPAMASLYDDEATRCGTTPGMVMGPPAGLPTSVFVSTDVDRAWAEMGPYLLHDAVAYRSWMGPGNNSASVSSAATVEELRAEAGPYRIVDPDGAVALIRTYGALALQPLCGGMPPALAWTSLDTVLTDVMPRLSA